MSRILFEQQEKKVRSWWCKTFHKWAWLPDKWEWPRYWRCWKCLEKHKTI